MGRITSILRNPLVWFSFLLVFLAVDNNLLNGEFKNVIRSDGRGYYAYLPAVFIYNDPTFESSLQSEKAHAQPNFNQYYLYQTAEGRRYNKYFPGIAILQAPFFGAGYVAAMVSGAALDGYSEPFEFAFLLGSLFYSILGLWLLFQCIQLRFPELKKSASWITISIYVATTLLMYNTYTLGLSHHYSFFLFSLFGWCILQFRENARTKFVIGAGLTLGLIALLRPTNILVVLAIPLLFKDASEFISAFRLLSARKGRLLFGAAASFLLVFSLLFVLWKWQSGQWITWSYSGEGFNFLNPAFTANLFSFRNGIFLHTPLILAAAVGSVFLVRKHKFFVGFWWLYFLVNTWVISSWWCWDYETSFGNRPFTEHTFFLLLPLFFFIQKKTKLLWSVIIGCVLLGGIRYGTYVSGYMIDQRFTKGNYITSLAFWKEENFNRWRYGQSVVPFGDRVQEEILTYHKGVIEVSEKDEFVQTVVYDTPANRTNERLYFRVWLEKNTTKKLDNLYLVVHATDDHSDFTHYHAVPLYNDKLDGINEWAKVSLSGQIPDHFNDFEKVTMYIWNQGRDRLKLRNVQMYVDTYKS